MLGVDVTPALGMTLLRFLDLFYAWNAYAGFTAISRADAVRLHLLDSLAVAPALASAKTIWDLGSGGGMPGIPLALCLPRSSIDLVESKRRRCSFLAEAIRELDLDRRVTVTEADARRLKRAETPDAIVARAFLPRGELLPVARSILAPGGLLIAMAGGQGGSQVSIDEGFEVVEERNYALPGGDEKRSLLTVRRRSDDCFT